MCYEIILAWLILTPVFAAISVFRAASPRISTPADRVAVAVDSMLRLYKSSFIATFITCLIAAILAVPLFVVLLLFGDLIAAKVDIERFIVITCMIVLYPIWIISHVFAAIGAFAADN